MKTAKEVLRMLEAEIIEQVASPFGFLFEQYGYRAIACRLFANDGNWIVVLESPSCGRLLVLRDRGEIIVALSPHGSPEIATDGRWFDIAVVVEYLSRGQHMLEAQLDGQERELARLAGILQPYMEQVRELFALPDLGGAQDELDRIGQRREEELDCPSGATGAIHLP